MSFVVTLISAPKDRALTPALADMASRAIGARSIDWLADNLACDLLLPAGADGREAEAALRQALAGEPVDIAVQQADSRRKRLLIADMDSTMIDQECIDELADEVGLREHVAEITRRRRLAEARVGAIEESFAGRLDDAGAQQPVAAGRIEAALAEFEQRLRTSQRVLAGGAEQRQPQRQFAAGWKNLARRQLQRVKPRRIGAAVETRERRRANTGQLAAQSAVPDAAGKGGKAQPRGTQVEGQRHDRKSVRGQVHRRRVFGMMVNRGFRGRSLCRADGRV
jgi:hypothetical protein